MQKLKVTLKLEMKSDPEDPEMLEADIREELRALAEEEGELVYSFVEMDGDEDEEEEFDP